MIVGGVSVQQTVVCSNNILDGGLFEQTALCVLSSVCVCVGV